MKILYDPTLRALPSDLGLRVRADALYIPRELEALLRAMNIQSTDTLVAVLESFPTAIVSHLRWSAAEGAQATAHALAQLQDAGIIPRASTPPTRRGTGALPPGWLK